MKEIVWDWEEFKKRVDKDKPIHYYTTYKPLDKWQEEWQAEIRVIGIAKDFSWLLEFQKIALVETPEMDQTKKEKMIRTVLEKLKEQYADEVKATEGTYITKVAEPYTEG